MPGIVVLEPKCLVLKPNTGRDWDPRAASIRRESQIVTISFYYR